ncbi:quinone-dependent dihydroorotate dehydrogenase [Pararhodobacter oceanensis]|uniref:quinone-dependent dihydroorotate dehydrogenase n=1 Tax=Pararhodobacter oceanensis TaxID=2172121 RepID=UPI003A93CC15
MISALGLKAMHRLDPERAHHLALRALRLGLVPATGVYTSERLRCQIAGLELPNPVGLAAGFDKNAVALAPLAKQGFGFLEVGAATPRPQEGNPRPRLFRLSEDQAVINRFGFNNEGAQAIAARLAKRPKGRGERAVVGLNLGANKDSADRADDFAQVLRVCGPHVDFATVNVSSPNTEKLRYLQGPEALRTLLAGVIAARDEMAGNGGAPIPIFLKIAPDLDAEGLAGIAEVAVSSGLDAVIATNTTLSREGLVSAHAGEAGGLSGAPLFERSTRVLAQLSKLTDGALPLIGVGGIASAEDAYAKILAGASAVQIYSALVYHGMTLVDEITRGLDALLERDGFETIAQATGKGRDAWL